MNTGNTVKREKQNPTIRGTGWSWADAVEATLEARRESSVGGSDLDRILARHGVELARDGEEMSLDEALEHSREARELARLHRSPAQRALHRLGECRCHQQ